MKKWFWVLLILCASSPLIAQEDEDEEIEAADGEFPQPKIASDAFFEDNKATLKGNAFKADAVSLLRGDLYFAYERKIYHGMSAEVCGGMKFFMGPTMWTIMSMSLEEGPYEMFLKPTQMMKSPFYGVHVKKYFMKTAIDAGVYMGLQYLASTVSFKEDEFVNINKFKTSTFRFTYGAQLLLKERISFDWSSYVGGIKYTLLDPVVTPDIYYGLNYFFDYGLSYKFGIFF